MVLRREQERWRYAGFNLVLVDSSGAWLLSNRDEAGVTRLPHGLYGVSNATLDKPWAKVTDLACMRCAAGGRVPRLLGVFEGCTSSCFVCTVPQPSRGMF